MTGDHNDGIFGNPDPDFFDTVEGFGSITEWAEANGTDLESALDAGVCADDGSDAIYVPRGLFDPPFERRHNLKGDDKS